MSSWKSGCGRASRGSASCPYTYKEFIHLEIIHHKQDIITNSYSQTIHEQLEQQVPSRFSGRSIMFIIHPQAIHHPHSICTHTHEQVIFHPKFIFTNNSYSQTTHEQLEKRVRSRFSGRSIMFMNPSCHENSTLILRAALTIPSKALEAGRNSQKSALQSFHVIRSVAKWHLKCPLAAHHSFLGRGGE